MLTIAGSVNDQVRPIRQGPREPGIHLDTASQLDTTAFRHLVGSSTDRSLSSRASQPAGANPSARACRIG
jgi:hypothetical protein